MTDPTSPYVNVREMHAMESALLARIERMERAILAKMETEHEATVKAIAASDEHHEHVHGEMRTRADDRHRRIDDFIQSETAMDTMAKGRGDVYRSVLAGLRMVNEFRWLIVLLVGAVLVMLNDFSFTVGAP